MSAIEALLESYRAAAISQRDKGTAFGRLATAWLVTDPVQALRINRVQTWAEWAAKQGQDRQGEQGQDCPQSHPRAPQW